MRLYFPHQPRLQVTAIVRHQLDTHQVFCCAGSAIEKRAERFDLSQLQQQCPQLACGFCVFDSTQAFGNAHTATGVVITGKMRSHSLRNIDALAHIQKRIVFTIKSIHPRTTWQITQGMQRKVRRNARSLQQGGNRLLQFRIALLSQRMGEKLEHCRNIPHGPVPLHLG